MSSIAHRRYSNLRFVIIRFRPSQHFFFLREIDSHHLMAAVFVHVTAMPNPPASRSSTRLYHVNRAIAPERSPLHPRTSPMNRARASVCIPRKTQVLILFCCFRSNYKKPIKPAKGAKHKRKRAIQFLHLSRPPPHHQAPIPITIPSHCSLSLSPSPTLLTPPAPHSSQGKRLRSSKPVAGLRTRRGKPNPSICLEYIAQGSGPAVLDADAVPWGGGGTQRLIPTCRLGKFTASISYANPFKEHATIYPEINFRDVCP